MKRNVKHPVVFVTFKRELPEVFEELVFRVAFAVDIFNSSGVVENIENRADTLFASRVGIPITLQAVYVSRFPQIRISLNTL